MGNGEQLRGGYGTPDGLSRSGLGGGGNSSYYGQGGPSGSGPLWDVYNHGYKVLQTSSSPLDFLYRFPFFCILRIL